MCPSCGVTLSTDGSGASYCANTNCPWVNAKGYPYRVDAAVRADEKAVVVADNSVVGSEVIPTAQAIDEVPNQ